ncbi:hypothetical protein [Mesorhizobium sp. WSM2239]|uniref:HEAT repeat domain-containing protein n=2 Tax=unclassified Mesorhizobium TaxID=325217 RepID=A0AAU8DGJ0_9HYPH
MIRRYRLRRWHSWLSDPVNHGLPTATLRWQAMAALEEVEGDYVLELTGLFGASWPMRLLARLRNGDVEGGVELSARHELSSVAYWTRGALAAAKERKAEMVAALAALLDDNSVAKRRRALIAFAGVLGDPTLTPFVTSACPPARSICPPVSG